jgi:hypothetical protein
MSSRGELVVSAILASLLCACLPNLPDGELGGSETLGDSSGSAGTQGDETQSGGSCEPSEQSCTDETLERCIDGRLEVTACDEVCAQSGQVSNGCNADECACAMLPEPGVWSGMTAAGHPLLLALSEDGRLLGLVTLVDVDTFGCTGEAGLTARLAPLVEGGAFVVEANLVIGDAPTTITGEFTSPAAVQGTIDGYSGGYALVCDDSLEIGSGSVFEGTSWSATPCTDCSMTCAFEADDQCDEPEGTGLCFDGTDAMDCG